MIRKKRKNISSKMNMFKEGQEVVMIQSATNGRQTFKKGQVVTIHSIDNNDDTLIVVDDKGERSSWISKSMVRKHVSALEWGLVRKMLDEDTAAVIETCFEGWEFVSLKEEVRDYLLAKQPDLLDAVQGYALARADERAAKLVMVEPDVDFDDDNDPLSFLDECEEALLQNQSPNP